MVWPRASTIRSSGRPRNVGAEFPGRASCFARAAGADRGDRRVRSRPRYRSAAQSLSRFSNWELALARHSVHLRRPAPVWGNGDALPFLSCARGGAPAPARRPVSGREAYVVRGLDCVPWRLRSDPAGRNGVAGEEPGRTHSCAGDSSP